jgi:hypothetical protein
VCGRSIRYSNGLEAGEPYEAGQFGMIVRGESMPGLLRREEARKVSRSVNDKGDTTR